MAYTTLLVIITAQTIILAFTTSLNMLNFLYQNIINVIVLFHKNIDTIQLNYQQ